MTTTLAQPTSTIETYDATTAVYDDNYVYEEADDSTVEDDIVDFNDYDDQAERQWNSGSNKWQQNKNKNTGNQYNTQGMNNNKNNYNNNNQYAATQTMSNNYSQNNQNQNKNSANQYNTQAMNNNNNNNNQYTGTQTQTGNQYTGTVQTT